MTPQKKKISFLRDEMEKSREHELKLFQLMLGNRANSGMPPSSMEAGIYPPWNQGSAHCETGFYPSMQNSVRAQQTTHSMGTLSCMVLVNTRHCKSYRTESMFIRSTTVLSTWPVIICDHWYTHMGKYSGVKTKQEKPQLKALNTGNLFLWKNRVFFHNSDFWQVLD